jgi:hypothetical protein
MNKQLKNTSCFDRSKLTQQQNLRENVKELFNTLKEQNGLAWKEIVRNYKQQQKRESYDNLRQSKNIISKS